MVKKQQGVALIIALIVTAIVGIIAISLSSTAFRTQRSQNISVGTATSHSNAVSGINRAINFLRASALEQQHDVFVVKSLNNKDVIIINGEPHRIPDIFRGVEDQIEDDYVNATLNDGQDLWYRAANWWTNNNCLSCVNVEGENNVFFRIEKRGCRQPQGASIGPSESIPCNVLGGHRMFRITALGSDGTLDQDNPNPIDVSARTIIQTHIGIRDIE